MNHNLERMIGFSPGHSHSGSGLPACLLLLLLTGAGVLFSLFLKVIIKQEPGEVSTQQQMVSTATAQQQQQQPVATAAHQFVAVKGSHVVSMSPQKPAGGAAAAMTSKV